MVARKCQPSSKDRANHTDTSTTPHYFSSVVWYDITRKVVCCGCGVNVVCSVFGGRWATTHDPLGIWSRHHWHLLPTLGCRVLSLMSSELNANSLRNSMFL